MKVMKQMATMLVGNFLSPKKFSDSIGIYRSLVTQVAKWGLLVIFNSTLTILITSGKQEVIFSAGGGQISIGKGTYIAQNVGLITENHDISNLDNHLPPKNISIGKNCWIGMNSVLLPGVVLGDKTIVGAGAVVTSSFPEGHVVLGGVPARVIKSI